MMPITRNSRSACGSGCARNHAVVRQSPSPARSPPRRLLPVMALSAALEQGADLEYAAIVSFSPSTCLLSAARDRGRAERGADVGSMMGGRPHTSAADLGHWPRWREADHLARSANNATFLAVRKAGRRGSIASTSSSIPARPVNNHRNEVSIREGHSRLRWPAASRCSAARGAGVVARDPSAREIWSAEKIPSRHSRWHVWKARLWRRTLVAIDSTLAAGALRRLRPPAGEVNLPWSVAALPSRVDTPTMRTRFLQPLLPGSAKSISVRVCAMIFLWPRRRVMAALGLRP